MQLELNDQERAILVELLTSACYATHTGIHHAMDHETREGLRQRRALLESLLTRLGASLQPAR